MSKKLSAPQKKKLESIGVKGVKTDEEAKLAMIAFLEKEGIDDNDDETYDDLFDMCEAIYEGSDTENDDLVEEVDEEELEEELEDELEDEEEDEDELEDEEEDKKPAKKAPKKAAKKAPKKTAKKEEAEEEVEEKPVPKKKSKKRINPKENEDDAAKFDGLKEATENLAPDYDFEFNFIANGGVTVKFLGNNGKRVFYSFDSPKFVKDSETNEISARVYFPSLKEIDKVEKLFSPDYFTIKADWSSNLLVQDVTLSEFTELIKSEENSKELGAILKRLGKKDEKLGKNREKMEADLKSEKEEKIKKIKSKPKKEEPKKEEPKKSVKKKAPKKEASKK